MLTELHKDLFEKIEWMIVFSLLIERPYVFLIELKDIFFAVLSDVDENRVKLSRVSVLLFSFILIFHVNLLL